MLRTPRLLLRPLVESDRAEFIRVLTLSDALHRPWSPHMPPGFSYDTIFERGLIRHEQGTTARFAGFLDDGRIGGFFNLNEIVRGPFQNAYAGWSVNAEVAGLGLATEGVAGLLRLAFGPLGLHRVQANIIPRNLRSIRVAEKNKFRLEGRARRYLEINGVWEDHLMYAKLREEMP